uniref:Uncharacterized protein n=1 Tax=Romanomermis culicivorax TaxID=13658 RepID=A0A915HXU5_ROMCU
MDLSLSDICFLYSLIRHLKAYSADMEKQITKQRILLRCTLLVIVEVDSCGQGLLDEGAVDI